MINAYERKHTGKILAIIVAIAMIVTGVVMFSGDNGVDAADTQNYSGTLNGQTVHQDFPAGTDVIINGDLTITNGASMTVQGNLTINQGVTVTINNGGSLTVNGGLVTVNGTVTVTGSSTITSDEPAESTDVPSKFVINAPGSPDETKLYDTYGVVVNGTLSVLRGASIEAGANGGNVLVNNGGNFSVTSSGTSRVSTISNLDVDIANGGTFSFNGRTSGEDDKDSMVVSAYGEATICTNAEATITSTGKSNTLCNLTFTASSSRSTVYYTPTAGGNVTSGPMTEFALNISGTIDNNSTVVLSGDVKTGVAEHDTFYTSQDAANRGALGYFDPSSNMVKFAHNYGDIALPHSIISDLRVNAGSTLQIGTSEGDMDVKVTVTGTLNMAVTSTTNTTPAKLTGYGTLELNGAMVFDKAGLTGFKTEYGGLYVNGTLTVYNIGADVDFGLVGAGYVDNDGIFHATGNLQTSIDAAVAAGINEVFVLGGYKSSHDVMNGTGPVTNNGANDIANDGYGSFVISSNVTVPENMILNIERGVLIQEGVTMTVSDSAIVEFDDVSKIWVKGKLVDYDTIGTDEARDHIDFEVMSSVEDGNDIINTYTTFAIALSETTSGTIYLYDDITIDRNMAIPENVTVQYADSTTGSIGFKEDTNYTFTINGVLYLSSGHDLNTTDGTVVVNNVIRYVNGVLIGETAGTPVVAGAYFAATLEDGDNNEYNYITSVSYAADNSTSIDGTISIYGNVAMGDVKFTKGENADSLLINIMNSGDDIATGNVTLVGGASMQSFAGFFDGSVTMETSDGTSVIEFDESRDFIVSMDSVETTDGTVTSMVLGSSTTINNEAVSRQINGTVTISSGTVAIDTATSVQKIIVSADATLSVGANLTATANPGYRYNTIPSNLPLLSESFFDNTSGLVVDGTMVIDGDGTPAIVTGMIAHVTGTVTITEGQFVSYVSCVEGTITASDNGSIRLDVGVLRGTVSGDVHSYALVAYPGSDVQNADIMVMPETSTTDAESTVVYVNGEVLATMYGSSDVPVEMVLLASDVTGVQYNTAKFYSNAAMTDVVADLSLVNGHNAMYDALLAVINAFKTENVSLQPDKDETVNLGEAIEMCFEAGQIPLGPYTEIYIGMEPANVNGTISVGTGLNLYIDNLAWNKTDMTLGVGTHTITFDVSTGYDGSNTTITFNGQTVQNGGTITITSDMTTFTLIVSGAVPSSGQTVVVGGDGDNGMGLTDYLLIILVILIVIMAIMVALRLMRS